MVRKLKESISKLCAELVVTKNANNLLLNRLTILERQCWENAQYPRREGLDIVGIPREVFGEVLEQNVLKVFGKLGCDVSPYRIEACHRVGRITDALMVMFSKRNSAYQYSYVRQSYKPIVLLSVSIVLRVVPKDLLDYFSDF